MPLANCKKQICDWCVLFAAKTQYRIEFVKRMAKPFAIRRHCGNFEQVQVSRKVMTIV
jgi:hypothetical protein